MPDAQEAAMWGNAMTIARIWGFEIKIDASWILIASLIVWSLATVHFPSELPDASRVTLVAAALVAMLGLFAGLILHELAHSVIARRLGVRV
ncbi:MAG: site-2 protease family protein, partial [Armatimonadetes bacterium]|nr:site-2 protease family protein [Armatimonadota bacterium]